MRRGAVLFGSIAAGCLALGAAAARADTINPDTADVQISSDNGSPPTITFDSTTDYQARIGEFYSPGGACYVMPFELPTLPAGDVFTSADLRTQLYTLVGTPDAADLYGVRVNASPTVLASDYYQGPADPSATLIQQDYLTASSPVRTDPTNGPFIDTTTDGDAALVAYLNAVDPGGANAGDYVFLRVSYDDATIPPGNNAYDLLTEDASGANEKPLLTFTDGPAPAMPEPASLGLLGIGAIGLLGRRR